MRTAAGGRRRWEGGEPHARCWGMSYWRRALPAGFPEKRDSTTDGPFALSNGAGQQRGSSGAKEEERSAGRGHSVNSADGRGAGHSDEYSE